MLEKEGLALGVVTAIDGVTRAAVEIDGVAGHAGTVPMSMRSDALAAAAEMLVAIEGRARSRPNLLATVGKLDVSKAAANTIPGQVRFSLDIRSPFDRSGSARRGYRRHYRFDGAAARGDGALVPGHEAAAAYCDRRLSDRLAAAVEACGVEARRLPSGAGHDAMAFDRVIPFAMLFVRCRGGISHSPAEFASPADIDVAARALSTFLDSIGAQP